MEIIRYFVIKDNENDLTLARVVEDDTKLWGEYFDENKGQWIKDHVMTNFLIDPLMGDEVSQEEAQEIVKQWGYKI